jgi:spore coat protein A
MTNHDPCRRRSNRRVAFSLVLAIVLAVAATGAMAAVLSIDPVQDNTMAQELPDNSSGSCDSIFVGNTDGSFARRALLKFDIAGSIPPESTINSVVLSMTVTRGGNNNDSVISLHAAASDWGEGPNGCGARGGGQGEPADPGAATWSDAQSGSVPWLSAGGDFDPTPSALTAIIGNVGNPIWDSGVTGNEGMAADVQAWLDTPAVNHGWILIGDESNPTTTRRFDSREGAARPTLTIDFTPSGTVEACCQTDGSCSLTIPGSNSCNGTTMPLVDFCEPNQCPQPTGACCNVDESCSDSIDRLDCESAGGIFQGAASACSLDTVDCGLTPFVDALPIPPVLQPTGTRADGVLQYTVSVQTATQSAHSELPDTDLWTYNGAWPAATIAARKGEPIEVTYINDLPSGGGGKRGNNLLEVDTCAHGPNYYGDSKRVVTHLHGGHVPSRFDGQPEYTILPGETDVYEYPNNQDAGILWYHDHALGTTRLNVYAGMAGFYLLGDDDDTLGVDNAFGLPSGEYDVGLAIQDRTFNEDGSLFYNAQLEDAFKGDKLLVNGKVWPYMNVKQGKYRFRLLNGSQSREYILRLENITDPGNDPSFLLVGTDLGLISAPFDLGNSWGRFSPAERMDVVVDFAGFPAGTEIVLRNGETSSPRLPNVMKFIVTDEPGYTGAVSDPLRTVAPMAESSADATRYFWLTNEAAVPCKDGSNRTVNEWLIQSLLESPAPPYDPPADGDVIGSHWDDLSEFPMLGTREIWEFYNPTSVMHPMHVHLVRFQILDKTNMDSGQVMRLKPWEVNTWKDTVRVPPRSIVRIIMDFEDYLGRFPQHCHILDHEDHEMMRQFQTVNDPENCNNDGACDPGEDCQSCPSDCAKVSGALCGNGLCEAGDGENFANCPQDCNGKQKGAARNQFSCGADDGQVNEPVPCSDPRCIDSASGWFCREAPRVPACCGDALCEGAETEASCAVDCAPPPAVCVPDETPEQSCFDAQDNDCDLALDCSDSDCSGAIGPATSCGVGFCASIGNLTCSGGAEVDSCTPGTPGVEGPFGNVSCSDGLDNDCDGETDGQDSDCLETPQACSDLGDRQSCRDAGCRWKKNVCTDP